MWNTHLNTKNIVSLFPLFLSSTNVIIIARLLTIHSLLTMIATNAISSRDKLIKWCIVDDARINL